MFLSSGAKLEAWNFVQKSQQRKKKTFSFCLILIPNKESRVHSRIVLLWRQEQENQNKTRLTKKQKEMGVIYWSRMNRPAGYISMFLQDYFSEIVKAFAIPLHSYTVLISYILYHTDFYQFLLMCLNTWLAKDGYFSFLIII